MRTAYLHFEKKCLNCKETFKVERSALKTRKFCCFECSVAYRNEQYHKNCRFLKCCICKGPTKYVECNYNRKNIVHCSRFECSERVRLRKNERIRKTNIRICKLGLKKVVANPWANVSRVSKEEQAIGKFLLAQGWVSQHYVKTKLKTWVDGKRVTSIPAWYSLDFAKPRKKLYIEIDGDSHRTEERKFRDKRRNRVLKDLGWRGLRIPAQLVNKNIEKVKAKIQRFFKTI